MTYLTQNQVNILAGLADTWVHGSEGGWTRASLRVARALERKGLVVVLEPTVEDSDDPTTSAITADGMRWLTANRPSSRVDSLLKERALD